MVKSGDPTKTTFGNTIRVICYLEFVLFNAKITKYKMYVSGDDIFLLLERN